MITIPPIKTETVLKYDKNKRREYFDKYARYISGGGYAIYLAGIITAEDTKELYEKFEKTHKKLKRKYKG